MGQTQIATIKRRYEQQINTLNQEKMGIEKKWKQKLISLHKKYGVNTQHTPTNNTLNIGHIENITISSNTPRSHSEHNQSSHCSLSAQSTVTRSRRKRKRSVLDEFGADYKENKNKANKNGNDDASESSIKKRAKKKRKMEHNGLLDGLLNDQNNEQRAVRR